MKKMLIMAMAVVALMACKNSSDTGLPKGEAKALKATTVGAVDDLGDSPKQVDATLTKAGYRKIQGGYYPFDGEFSAPARLAKKAKTAKADDQYSVTYAYGLPANYESMTKEQVMVWANNALAKGDAVMLVRATFTSNKLSAMYTMFIIAKSGKANQSFTAISDDLYGKLPSGKNNYGWEGWIGNSDNDDEEMEYTDHSKFVSKVAKAEGIIAEEYGAAFYKGWYYGNVWFNPSEADEQDQLEEGFDLPFCEGAYLVAEEGTFEE